MSLAFTALLAVSFGFAEPEPGTSAVEDQEKAELPWNVVRDSTEPYFTVQFK